MEVLLMASEKVHYILIFLFILLANFIGDVNSCSLRRLLTNMKYKHIISFFTLLIFVTVELYESASLIDILTNTIIMYTGFIFLMRSHIYFTLACIFLITICYIITLHIEYLKKQNKEEKEINIYRKIRYYSFLLAILILIVGVISNVYILKHQLKNKFSVYKFFLGLTNEECLI